VEESSEEFLMGVDIHFYEINAKLIDDMKISIDIEEKLMNSNKTDDNLFSQQSSIAKVPVESQMDEKLIYDIFETLELKPSKTITFKD
jgi:hypothetical protein